MSKEGPPKNKTPEVSNEKKFSMQDLWKGNEITNIDDIGESYIKEVHRLAELLTKATHDDKAIAPNIEVDHLLSYAIKYLSDESKKDGISEAQKQAILKERQILEALSVGLSWGKADTENLWKDYIPSLKKRT